MLNNSILRKFLAYLSIVIANFCILNRSKIAIFCLYSDFVQRCMPVKQLAPTEYRAKRNSSSFGSWNNSLHYGIQTLQTGMKQPKVKYKCKKSNFGKRSSKQIKKIKTNKKNLNTEKTCWRLINLVLYQRRCICVAGYHLGCVADLIYPRLVMNVCKTVPISLFWAKNELNVLTLVRFEFPFNSIGKCQWLFFNMPVMARTSFYNRLSSQK